MLLCQTVRQTIFRDSILVKLDMMAEHHWKLRAERVLPVKSSLCISPCWTLKDCSMYRIGPLSLKKYKFKKLCSFSFLHISKCLYSSADLSVTVFFALCGGVLYQLKSNISGYIIAKNENNLPPSEKHSFICFMLTITPLSLQIIQAARSVAMHSCIQFPFSACHLCLLVGLYSCTY